MTQSVLRTFAVGIADTPTELCSVLRYTQVLLRIFVPQILAHSEHIRVLQGAPFPLLSVAPKYRI